jgi:hypothetical protein
MNTYGLIHLNQGKSLQIAAQGKNRDNLGMTEQFVGLLPLSIFLCEVGKRDCKS